MAIPIIGDIIGSVIGKAGDIIDKVVVDKDKKLQAQFDLERMKLDAIQQAEQRVHEEVKGQLEINKTEAQHASIFVAGWRPFVGWVSGAGLAYGVILEPLFSWTARVWFNYNGTFPEIDPTLLIFSLGGMLGIGGMRTIEKIKGVSSDTISDSPAASRNTPQALSTPLPENAPWQK